MVTDNYRSVVGGGNGNEYSEELGRLLRDRAIEQEVSDRERELLRLRSGSAPPIVQGSLGAAFIVGGGESDVSKAELRSDPSYPSYFYQNVNQRLPAPPLSEEEWWSRGKMGRTGGGGGESLFSMQPEFGGDGLIGLPSLGLENQGDDIRDVSSISRRPSLLAGTAFQDSDSSESYGGLHHDLPSLGVIYSGPQVARQINPSSMGSSLSRNTTPDPQAAIRSPSPRIPVARRNVNINIPNSYADVSYDMADSADLVASLSGLSLSMDSPIQRNNNSFKQHPYLNITSPTSSLSNYNLGDYPSSPLVLGNHGISPFATAPELENFARLGNHSPEDALLLDPSFVQYLRSNGYSTPSPRINQESRLALQKAYFEALLQKSQYGLPFGKSNFVPGFQYPGNPMPPAVFPNSPIGSGMPSRHMEQIMRFPSSLRNFMGGPYPQEPGSNFEESFAASLLDEFKGNKARCFELSEIVGHVVEFSADQYGSRFIQQKLETANTQEKNMVFVEIMPQALSLMTDVFGNYVIQKFFEHGSASQVRKLAEQLFGHVLNLSLQMYGCRVIQKAIEVIDLDQQTKMVAELDGHVMRCVRDQNGNHVIQKCIECIPEVAIHFIISTFYDQVVTLSTHPYGCRVIQRVLEHCRSPKTQSIVMKEILQSVCMLTQDQYGNYVIQHVLEHGKPHERSAIIGHLVGKIVEMSQQKFASNVIEKCLSFGTPEERQSLVHEMLGTTDENEPLQVMMKDQFANYVVQKVLETCDDQQLELLLSRIKVHLSALKKYTYGKHIVARVEKLVAAGERRISILSSYSALTA